MRPVMGMAFAAAGVLVVASGSVQAQSITSVPDNAILMVKVNNLEQTSRKLGVLFQDWGVAAFNPALADPLVAMEGMANLQQGLNRAGEGALIMVNPMAAPGGQGAPTIIMLPVSDYDAFIKNFPDAQADGDLTMITMPVNNNTAYVAKWGGFAAVSENRMLVSRPPKATKFTGLNAKEMQGRDIIAYVNFAGFRAQAAGGLSFGRGMAIGQVDQQMQQKPEQAKYAPVAVAALNQLFNGLDHLVNETQAMTLGVDLSQAGMQFTYMAEFVPESYLAKMATAWKPQEMKLTAGLPEAKYFMAGGMAFDNATLGQLIDDITNPIREEAAAIGEPGKPLVGYIDAVKTSVTSTSSQSWGVSTGRGEVGAGPLFDFLVVTRGDVEKLVPAQRELARYQDEFMKVMQPQGQVGATTQIKESAKTVAGVSFDQMTTSFTGGNPNAPDRKMMEMFYGKDGFTMFLGKVDAKTLLSISAQPDAQVQQAISAAKAGTDPLASNAQVKETSAKLPQNPTFVAYMFPDQVMTLASRVSQAVGGMPLQTKLPENMQPIVLSGNTEQTAVKINVYVPSSVVKAGVQAGMQEAMRQQRPRNAAPKQQDDAADQGL